MSVNGLACNYSGVNCLIPRNGPTKPCSKLSSLSFNGRSVQRLQLLSKTHRKYRNAFRPFVSAAFGDSIGDSSGIFPRINVRDPYQRLGISREASQEEIQAARNFLINKYAGHKPSIDSIESAHDKIIMQQFFDRKNPKIDLNKKVREVTQSRVFRFLASRFEAPSGRVILKTAVAFLLVGVLTVLYPTEEGPTLQVAISLALTIYFIYERLRSKLAAFLYGVGSFFASWLIGTFLMVSVMPPIFTGMRSLEVGTSLITYILLWISSAYLK